MAKKTAELKIEDALWQAADQLRGSMDASQYRNVVLGLIFLKYVSDSFNEKGADVKIMDRFFRHRKVPLPRKIFKTRISA
ncbi:type I restriction-modification system subunit M N-terminal domain-containing protein, partial [Weissella cibaria]|uniref:type I restriction-modification system subunit M N-terminal domain-containing protein n=1 Tax=Weissella cibaria TaxID=137591 RepID=UPI0021D52971